MISSQQSTLSTNLDRTTLGDDTVEGNSLEKRILKEKNLLLNAANKQQPTLPDFNTHFTDSNIEVNQKWLNCLNRFTTNFTQVPKNSDKKVENAAAKDCLSLLHRLTFSKFSETRVSAHEPYKKWVKFFKQYFPDFKYQILYQCPQQANFLSYTGKMPKLKDKKYGFGYRAHKTAKQAQYHYDIANQIGVHFECLHQDIWDSTTMINYWLKLTERASRYPREDKLFFACAKMYTEGYLKYWPEQTVKENKYELLKYPFGSYLKTYSPEKMKNIPNVLDSNNYSEGEKGVKIKIFNYLRICCCDHHKRGRNIKYVCVYVDKRICYRCRIHAHLVTHSAFF